MSEDQFQWQTHDGLTIFARSWAPDASPQALVSIVHGLGEHSGRYAGVAATLNSAGYAVVASDHRGHGRSQGKRGHAPSCDALMDDIDLLLAQSAQRFPGVPHFLYGHSMGGSLVLNHGLRRQPNITGVISSSPGLRPGFDPPAYKVALARLLNPLWPTLTVANELPVEGISRDPAVVAAYKADPLVHDRISVRLYVVLMEAGQWAIDHAGEFPVPLLHMHGTADRLASLPASQEFAAQAPAASMFQVWPDNYHELHNDLDREAVLENVVAWIDGNL